MAVGDKGLGAIEGPSTLGASGGEAGAARIGSSGGFSQSPGADPFAGGQLRDVLFFLRFIACNVDVIRAERGVRGDYDSHRTVDARKFSDGGYVLHVAHAGTAVFGREDDAQQAQLA